jgi:hypothetical protein
MIKLIPELAPSVSTILVGSALMPASLFSINLTIFYRMAKEPRDSVYTPVDLNMFRYSLALLETSSPKWFELTRSG